MRQQDCQCGYHLNRRIYPPSSLEYDPGHTGLLRRPLLRMPVSATRPQPAATEPNVAVPPPVPPSRPIVSTSIYEKRSSDTPASDAHTKAKMLIELQQIRAFSMQRELEILTAYGFDPSKLGSGNPPQRPAQMQPQPRPIDVLRW